MKYFSKKHDIERQTKGSAGIDLPAYLKNSVKVQPGEDIKIDTGIHVEIPEGFYGLVLPRSSFGIKKTMILKNTAGVIDSDYRGPIKLFLRNYGNDTVEINDGERIAQLIICPFEAVTTSRVESLDDLTITSRGSGGFGSTGK